MGRSHQSFSKREKEKKKAKKKKEKMERREERRDESSSGKLDDMIAYTDKYGNILDEPPEEDPKEEEIEAEDIVVGIPPKEKVEPPSQRNGKVSFFNDSKGYGFIHDEFLNDTIFFHVNETLEEVVENDKVTYEVEQGDKGPVAVKVQRL